MRYSMRRTVADAVVAELLGELLKQNQMLKNSVSSAKRLAGPPLMKGGAKGVFP